MTSQVLSEKVGVVFGVANKRSIAWAIAKAWAAAGARLIFNYQGERLKENVADLVGDILQRNRVLDDQGEIDGDLLLADLDVHALCVVGGANGNCGPLACGSLISSRVYSNRTQTGTAAGTYVFNTPNPAFGATTEIVSNINANYHALTVEVQKLERPAEDARPTGIWQFTIVPG